MSIIDDHGRARMGLVRSRFRSMATAPSSAGTRSAQTRPAQTTQADKLWDALFQARGRNSVRELADMEDAVFRFYLPMARTLANEYVDSSPSSAATQEAAEFGLAQAVLAWRHTSSRRDGLRTGRTSGLGNRRPIYFDLHKRVVA